MREAGPQGTWDTTSVHFGLPEGVRLSTLLHYDLKVFAAPGSGAV